MSFQNDPVYELPFLYVNGFDIVWASNTTLTITAGQCRDSINSIDIVIGSEPFSGPLTPAPVTLNAAINGINGLDTGTFAANKVYSVYAIGDSTYNNIPGTIVSLASNTVPALPFGYDSYRLIGYAVTDSSVHFLKGYIAGNGNFRSFTFDAPQSTAITAGNATSYTGVALTTLVPPVDNTPVQIFSALTPGAAGRAVFLQGFNSTGDAIVNLGQVTAVVLNNVNTVLAQLNSGAPSIKYKVSNAGDAVNLKVSGFNYFI